MRALASVLVCAVLAAGAAGLSLIAQPPASAPLTAQLAQSAMSGITDGPESAPATLDKSSYAAASAMSSDALPVVDEVAGGSPEAASAGATDDVSQQVSDGEAPAPSDASTDDPENDNNADVNSLPTDEQVVVPGSQLPAVDEVVPLADEHATDTVLVELNPTMDLDQVNAYLDELDYVATKEITESDIMFGYVALELTDDATVEQAMVALGESEIAASVEPDYIMYPLEGDLPAGEDGEPEPSGEGDNPEPEEPEPSTSVDPVETNDPLLNQQWELDAIHAREAWSVATTDHAVTVAVLDSGCKVDHEDLAGNIIAPYSILKEVEGGDVNDVTDEYGHGTQVASMVAAEANNEVGLAGASYNAYVMPVQVMSKTGGVSFSNAMRGVQHVIDTAQQHPEYNIRVLNISFGAKLSQESPGSRAFVAAIDAAYAEGLVVVCAAGNSNLGTPPFKVFPSDYSDNVINVINVTSDMARSPGSNYNLPGETKKNISAPGNTVNVAKNTSSNPYGTNTGTSFAAPMVAGVVALELAVNPDLTPSQAKHILLSTVEDIGDEGFDEQTGYGIVNAYDLVNAAKMSLAGPDSIFKGHVAQFIVPFENQDDWDWSTSDPSIATVDEMGNITGIEAGTAIITATNKTEPGLVTSLPITVYDASLPEAITVTYGTSTPTEFTSQPAGVWRWTSSDSTVAAVDSKGNIATGKVGTAMLTVALVSNPTISLSCEVTVEGAPIAVSDVSDVSAKVYTGSALEPTVKVSVNGRTLAAGTDYTLAFKNNVNVGTATYTVEGKGNYAGTISKSFAISAANIGASSVSNVGAQTYTGSAITPAVKVTVGGKTLKSGTDYTLAFKNNVDPGTASYTVTGKGNYAGTVTKTFAISKTAISDNSVSNVGTQTYTGSAVTPAVKVTVGGKTLQEGADYTLAFKNNVGPGTATYTVTGKGIYTGTVTKKFTIAKSAASWTRLSGPIALDTMTAIVDAGSFAAGGTVVLATVDGYWDALTAAGVAGLACAPVLMTDGEELSDQTAAELGKLKPKTIIVCGGEAAVSESVAAAAKKASGASGVVRLAGEDAVLTGEAIFKNGSKYAAAGNAWSKAAFLCTSSGYWDALSAAPVAYALHMPIFLTQADGSLAPTTLATMKAGGITEVYVVGGTAVVPASTLQALKDGGITVKSRLAGDDAVATSEKVAAFGLSCGMSANKLGVATIGGYWDALAGAALCGRNNAVLVLVDDEHSSSISGFVKSNAITIKAGYVFGGRAAVSDATLKALQKATPSS